MENNIRRPKTFEIVTAMGWTLLTYVQAKDVDLGYEEVMNFLQGPFRDRFLEYLNHLLSDKGEYAMFDNENNLLIKNKS